MKIHQFIKYILWNLNKHAYKLQVLIMSHNDNQSIYKILLSQYNVVFF